MPPPAPLIRTKLRPPYTRPGLVPRARLQAQIALGLRGPLTLVTAPAGFGKTTLVAACLVESEVPTAWLSLDKDDNQPARFLRYLVAAFQAADPAAGGEAARLLAAQPAPPELVLTSLVNDLDASGAQLALMLDDYQLISSPAVHEQVAFLLDHAPATFHLVIATRSDPPLPLARLRARGQVVELRAADLRFTGPEAVAFLNDVMGLHLAESAVAVLEERTEGWIAGLQMAALALQGLAALPARAPAITQPGARGREALAMQASPERFISEFAGTNRFIMDFMLEEVLAREPEEVQAFLLQTSVLNRLCGPLCDALTGASNGQEMLERLERRNIFIVPLEDGEAGIASARWYRYHHLFADLLQARLHQSGPEQANHLLSLAAAWCERDGQAAEAVSYALAARDYELAAGLIDRCWNLMVNNGEIETVWAWLTALPADILRASASLSIACCGVLWMMGRMAAIEPHLVDAERALGISERAIGDVDRSPGVAESAPGDVDHSPGDAGRSPGDAGRLPGDAGRLPGRPPAESAPDPALLAEIAVLRAILVRYSGDFAASCAHAERALALLPADLPPQTNAQLRGLVFLALASAYDGAGDLERAVDGYMETIHWNRLGANATGVAGVTFRLAGALRQLGRLRAAGAACRDALAYFQAQGMSRLPAAGLLHIAMSEVLVEQNELEAAEAHLAQAAELGRWSGRLDAVKNAAYALSRLRLARQDPTGALAAVEEAFAAQSDPPSPLARSELLALKACVLLRQGAGGASAEGAGSPAEEAARCAAEAVRLAGPDQGQTGALAALAALRVMAMAPSPPAGAAAMLAQAASAREERGRSGAAIELHILRSLALARQGEVPEAQADLERALVLAEPEGYARVFLEEGRPMRALLAGWLAHTASAAERGGGTAGRSLSAAERSGGTASRSLSAAERGGGTASRSLSAAERSGGPLRDYAARLLALFDPEQPAAAADAAPGGSMLQPAHSGFEETEAKPADDLLLEPLSQRELEVLQLMAQGRTNPQIAAQLIVAPGTIKAHAASIYRKLDVANRTEAVTRARRLGILP